MQTIHVERELAASAAFVFAQITDHAGYDRFPGVTASELIRPGTDHPNGVGAVRRIVIGPFVLQEVIERYQAPAAMAYRITRCKPLPINHKVGLINIESCGKHQCRVSWHSEFAVAVPVLGRLLGPILRQRMARGFAVILKTIEKRYQSGAEFKLLINRKDLHQHKLAEQTPEPLPPGGVRLKVDRFALTANNITYAVLGDSLSYWKFFPAEEGWGKLPVWGFADVVESACQGIAIGERIYGYFPFASELMVSPAKVNEYGFMDAAAHRRELPTVYNHYVRVANDPMYSAQRENLQAIFRPLFTTSFLLDDFLAEHDMFGAKTLILSSASSKTAISCAFLMEKFRRDRSAYELVGLTSEGNADYVKNLGCYDRVLDYSAIEQLDNSKQALFIDFAGNADLTREIHTHYADQLTHSCVAGVSHWQERAQHSNLPGPRPVMFFAPDQVTRRVAEWGQAGFAERLAIATRAFFAFVEDQIDIQEFKGPDAALKVFTDLLNGRMNPKVGYIVKFGTD